MASFEFESNDTLGSANTGIFGVVNGGQLSDTNDIDLFRFDLAEGALLNIKFTLPTGATNDSFRIVVRDAAGNAIFDNSGGADFSSINFSALAGTYYLEIRANNATVGTGSGLDFFTTEQYGLIVTTLPSIEAQGETEPNNNVAGATLIDIGEGDSLVDEVNSKAVIGNLTSSADIDYFRFTSAETGVYSFKFTAPTNVEPDAIRDTDPPGAIREFFKISILDEDQLVLVTHYVSDTTVAGYMFDFALDPILNPTGNYFVKIENGGSVGNINTQQYVFEINPVEASAANSTAVNGSFGNDFLLGTATSDIIKGNAGNDVLSGMAGSDILDGGLGIDTLKGGLGNDSYFVDATKDFVIENIGQGVDKVVTTVNYTLAVNVENLVLAATATIAGKVVGATSGTGNVLNNVIVGNDLGNTLNGLAGNDTIDGGLGIKGDVLVGGVGDDTYYLNNRLDKITEAAGVTGGLDTALAKVDVIALSNNVEILRLLEVGNNEDGSSMATYGTGNTIANMIFGNSGDNQLSGLGGNDTINGGAGNDALIGGIGNDSLTGGSGSDYFVFDKALSTATAPNVDRITDFKSGEDTIQLSKLIFSKLVGVAGNSYVGELSVANFVAGAGVIAAADANDYIIYNSTTGELYYDATGNTGAPAVVIANLGAGTALAYTDFTVL